MGSNFYQIKVGGQCHFTRFFGGHNTMVDALFVN